MATPTNKSIIKALDLVDIVCSTAGGLTLREAAEAANLTIATTHRLLRTLQGAGAVSLGRGGAYTLGPRLLTLHDRGVQAQNAVQEAVDAQLRQMLTAPGICVRLSVLDGAEIFIIAGADTCADPKRHAAVGARYEAYCTAPGKVMLAALSPRKLDEYVFNAGFVALTSRTIVAPSRLAEEIRGIQHCGYAVDSGEFFEGVRAVSVPVRVKQDEVIAALSVAGLGMSLDNVDEVVAGLQAHAGALAEEICRIPSGLRALYCLAGDLSC